MLFAWAGPGWDKCDPDGKFMAGPGTTGFRLRNPQPNWSGHQTLDMAMPWDHITPNEQKIYCNFINAFYLRPERPIFLFHSSDVEPCVYMYIWICCKFNKGLMRTCRKTFPDILFFNFIRVSFAIFHEIAFFCCPRREIRRKVRRRYSCQAKSSVPVRFSVFGVVPTFYITLIHIASWLRLSPKPNICMGSATSSMSVYGQRTMPLATLAHSLTQFLLLCVLCDDMWWT